MSLLLKQAIHVMNPHHESRDIVIKHKKIRVNFMIGYIKALKLSMYNVQGPRGLKFDTYFSMLINYTF